MKPWVGFLLLAALIAGAMFASPRSGAQVSDSSINLRRTTTVHVVEQTKDAVVYISSRKIVTQLVSPFGNDPVARQMFPNLGQMRPVPVGSLGSGFIVHPDGYIVTNNHVIADARQIKVTLLDGREYDAQLISSDMVADLAILKIDAEKPLPTLALGDSSDLMIGEPVIAVGNPLGFSHSVSTGIVSALHRDIRSPDEQPMAGDMIQTDAAINPGNSGGPLLNAYGQVIGINNMIRGDAQNIGFAIPINRLRDMIPQLMDPRAVSKLDIPVTLTELRTITPPATIRTTIVGEGDAPLETIAGVAPANIVDAYALLLRQHADQSFEVKFKDKAPMKITPKVMPLPDAVAKAKSKLGVTVEPVTPMLAERYRLALEDGMLITEVAAGGAAARVGLQPGDVIIQIGKFRVSNLKDLGYLLNQFPDEGKVPVGVVRGDRMRFLILQF
jgi:serine protease Do